MATQRHLELCVRSWCPSEFIEPPLDYSSNMNKPIVAFGIDGGYVYPFIISMLSARRCSTLDIQFILAFESQSLSSDSINLINEISVFYSLDLQLIELDLPTQLMTSSYITRIAYSKLVLASKIEKDFLWLDADTLCINSIDELLESNHLASEIGSQAIYARKDLNYRKPKKNKAFRRAGDQYFNTGVMRVNVNKWKACGYASAWLETALNYNKLGLQLHDQDIINYITYGKHEELPRKFNVMSNHEEISPSDSILHYADSTKPWKSPIIEVEAASYLFRLHHTYYLIAEHLLLNDLSRELILKEKLIKVREKCDQETSVVNGPLGLLESVHHKLAFLKWRIIREVKKILNRAEFSPIEFGKVEKRRKVLSDYLSKSLDFTVKYGPFTRLKLSESASWGKLDTASMLFGLYEAPVVSYLAEAAEKYKRRIFIDLGAADGFYVAGMLQSGQISHSYGYELDGERRSAIAQLSRLNNIESQITIRGLANSNFVDDFSSVELEQALLLIDIEGHEFELIQDMDLMKLRKTILVIELHDFFVNNPRDAVARLVARISETHKIKVIGTGARNLDHIPELHRLHDSDRWLICSEGRQAKMNWLCCEPIG